MNSETKKIAEKIQKLLALGSSANEHEADLALERAQSLMAQYNLTQSQVEGVNTDDVIEEKVMSYKKLATWKTQIISGIANAMGVKPINYHNHMTYVGYESSVINAKIFTEYLFELVERTVAVERAKNSEVKGRSYWNTFKVSMAQRLRARMEERYSKQVEEAKSIDSALVYDRDRSRRVAIQQFISSKGLQLSNGPKRTFKKNVEAELAGSRAGNNASINKQTAAASSRRSLPSG